MIIILQECDMDVIYDVVYLQVPNPYKYHFTDPGKKLNTYHNIYILHHISLSIMRKQIAVTVTEECKLKLDSLKVHPRETYGDVKDKLIGNNNSDAEKISINYIKQELKL